MRPLCRFVPTAPNSYTFSSSPAAKGKDERFHYSVKGLLHVQRTGSCSLEYKRWPRRRLNIHLSSPRVDPSGGCRTIYSHQFL